MYLMFLWEKEKKNKEKQCAGEGMQQGGGRHIPES